MKPATIWEYRPEVQRRLRIAAKELRLGKGESMKSFAKRHRLSDQFPVRLSEKLQRRYGGKFIARENNKVLASGNTYRKLLSAIRKRQLQRERLIIGYILPRKFLWKLSSIATRKKSRPPPLRVIVQEVRASRRAKRSTGVVDRTAGLLGKRFPPGVLYERRIRQAWAKRSRQTNKAFWRMIEQRRKEPAVSLDEMQHLVKTTRK